VLPATDAAHTLDRTDHETNNNALNRAGTERQVLRTIRTRQAEFLGHLIKKSKLVENLVMTGRFDGKKRPGRPRTGYVIRMKKWLDPTANENAIIQASATRERWRASARTGHSI